MQRCPAIWLALSLMAGAVGYGLAWEAKQLATHRLDSRFVGRWRLDGDDGVARAYLTVAGNRAVRGHASHLPCRPSVEGDEMHLLWDDGFHDVLRIEDGKMVLLALDDDGEVRFKLRAVPLKERP